MTLAKISHVLRSFPRKHLVTASSLCLTLGAAGFLLPDHERDGEPSASVALTIPVPATATGTDITSPGDTSDLAGAPTLAVQASAGADQNASRPQDEASLPGDPGQSAKASDTSTTVRSGDSLSAIFKREGLSSRDLYELVSSNPLGKRLKDISPGHQIFYTVDATGRLEQFEYVINPLQRLVFTRDSDTFNGQEVVREPERITAYKRGVIENSLFLSSQRAGLNDAMTMRLAQVFQWDIDFVLDIRRGDEFAVLFEELYIDGEFVGHGDILAAEFVNRGRTYRAVNYTDGNGDNHYYTPEGRPMRQAFLRAPVEFSRISSNFNLNRRHPLHNRKMPHRGIDYAAPTGTPILASGDGRVVTASRTAANGNYVVIQHGSQVTTKYLHLSKFATGTKQGNRVKQGQVIGYVGATGWATGPHLHYEFVVNGVHQNPRTVKLPQGDPIPGNEMRQFRERAAPLLALLDDHRQEHQFAMAR